MDFLNVHPQTIMVLGDIMLDVNIHGKVNRVANEAPIPIMVKESETRRLGGCGNVLMNLQGLGCDRLLVFSMIGNDSPGKEIQEIISKYSEIIPRFCIDDSYNTTVKTRGFNNKKLMFRFDNEKKIQLSKDHLDYCRAEVDNCLNNYRIDSIILSDYNNGFIVKELAEHVINSANKRGIPTFVDPKIEFSKYIGCTLFKPNLKELKDIFGIEYSCEKIQEIHETVKNNVKCKETMLTLSENGISYSSDNNELFHKKAVATEVCDVTGAGDIVISIIAYYYKYNNKQAVVELATWIGTHSVKHVGTYIIKKNDIVNTIKSIRNTKVITVDQFKYFNTPFLITNGCFDIVHDGHIELFKFCKSIIMEKGPVVVALNSDKSIRRLKGSTRPINSLSSRIALLNQIESIDWIVVFEEDTPYELYSQIKPTILVKGGDYTAESLIGREFCDQVRIFNYIPGKSTTNIIERIQELK